MASTADFLTAIADEVSSQDDLIQSIISALDGRTAGGTAEVGVYHGEIVLTSAYYSNNAVSLDTIGIADTQVLAVHYWTDEYTTDTVNAYEGWNIYSKAFTMNGIHSNTYMSTIDVHSNSGNTTYTKERYSSTDAVSNGWIQISGSPKPKVGITYYYEVFYRIGGGINE